MFFSEKQHRALQRRALEAHFDANETAFLERELTQLRAKIFQVLYPELLARTLVPKAGDIAPSAETYSFKIYEPIGKAKHIAYKGGDLPRVDVVAREVLGKVRPIGASYGWDINELREAARVGTPLPEMKARAARDTIERGIDETLAFGAINESGTRPDIGLTGLVNNSVVEGIGITAGSWWFAGTPPTPQEILAELNSLIAVVGQDSDRVFNANTLVLPVAHHDYIVQTPFSDLTGDSILSVFLKNNRERVPGLSVVPWHTLKTAGVGNKPRGIVYQKDPMILEGVIPQEYESLPPEARGLEFLINCHARCGGVKIYQPLAMRYIDFATS